MKVNDINKGKLGYFYWRLKKNFIMTVSNPFLPPVTLIYSLETLENLKFLGDIEIQY